ncbi:type IV pilus modification PilV family protein [Roseimaritima sediminicola]|uniref:type IV pilus modification PilV family protein n=1 Tax=Roseimaritima sediminicola TaxID=2662066 RepID=UPI001298298F|nr:hypothetical protein [Roseimaritima sediminicola]
MNNPSPTIAPVGRAARRRAPGAQRTRHTRAAVTIIEVLFAIGVILIGLVGVVALIPIAGRDAGEALRLDAANRIASSAAAELSGRNLRSLDGLVFLDIDPMNDDGMTPPTIIDSSTDHADAKPQLMQATPPANSRIRVVKDLLDRPRFLFPPPGNPVGRECAGLDAPGFALSFNPSAGFRETRMASFCIDPDFIAKNATTAVLPMSGPRNAYQTARFPYYSEWYSALTPPSAALPGVGTRPPLPRMYRVGVGSASSFVASMVADALTQADGSLMMHRPKDRTLPPSQVMNNMDAGSSVPGSRRSAGRYTWLATVTPPLDGSLHYNVTVVVIESREAYANTYDFASAPASPSAEENPASERVFWVTNPVQLGSTIEVSMYGPETVDADVRPGEWVMLSRQVYETDGSGTPVRPHSTQPAVHRWYRVQRILGKEEGPFNNQPPFTTLSGVWKRQVILEGPPWQFGFENNGNSATPETLLADDTYATVVEGAVSIREFSIQLDP